MSTIMVRIPAGKHERLRSMAKARGMSISRLMDELATLALTQYDTETFQGTGSPWLQDAGLGAAE
jgi:hypothetical protein